MVAERAGGLPPVPPLFLLRVIALTLRDPGSEPPSTSSKVSGGAAGSREAMVRRRDEVLALIRS
jgi:hypothetical protein